MVGREERQQVRLKPDETSRAQTQMNEGDRRAHSQSKGTAGARRARGDGAPSSPAPSTSSRPPLFSVLASPGRRDDARPGRTTLFAASTLSHRPTPLPAPVGLSFSPPPSSFAPLLDRRQLRVALRDLVLPEGSSIQPLHANMPFSGASPTPNAARLGRQGSISHRQRLLSTAALSVDEEIRRQEGGGFAIPMDSNSPVAGGPIRRLKTDDTEAGLPLHRRRGSLSRQAPDLNLRPPPVISSAARAEAAPPAPVSVDLPPSPSSSTRTFTQAYSLDRAHPPRSPLSTPLSELPAEALVDPFEPASTSFFPPSPGDSVPVGPVPISLPSVLPATDVADDAASPSQRVVPRLHLRTASGADIGLPSIQSLPSLPRGPSGFRLGRRPSVSGSPSPTREVFWGGQAGTARKSSAAVTPVGSDDGQSPLTPGGSVRILRPLPSPRGEFNLDTGKMLTVRGPSLSQRCSRPLDANRLTPLPRLSPTIARVATPKGERSAFIDATRSCPPLHSPLPSPLSSPTPAPQSDLHADPPAEQDDTDVLALVQRQPAIPVAVAQGSPPEPSRRTSVFSFTSGSSGLSTSSSATAGTSSALDTPSLVDRSILASPKPHLTVSKPPTLLPVEGEPLKPTTTTETAESEPLSPLLDGLRSRQNAARSGESRNGGLRRSSGALKLNLTDNERSVKGPSRFPTLLLGNVRDDEVRLSPASD